jgi:High potential iron-sulfur protein
MRKIREKLELTRRSILISAVGSTSVLAGMTNWAQAGAKIPQSAVYYQRSPKDGQECQHCAQFAGPNACKLVDGDISPTGWCRLWVKKAA